VLKSGARRALSFQAVAFGPSIDILRRMAQLATDIQNRAPPDPLHPAVPSSYTEALDTVSKFRNHSYLKHLSDHDKTQIQLAQTFLGLAESLRKPRGSLIRA
jgi:hypothetical protein